jgi:nicotinamide riboside kinase
MNKQSFLKIVLTGPESSGKTTLATPLAAALQAPWTPEFARFYLASLGRPYERTDLPLILNGQMAWEHWYLQKSEHFLVCDTDWTVVYIWEQYRFAPKVPWIGIPAASPIPVCYLLCEPDFPWQPDPLREHPEERSILFDRYQQLLHAQNLPFIVLSGDPQKRFAHAWQYIQDVYRP